MGLSPAVLRQLLVTETGAGPSRSSTGDAETMSEPEVFEFEFDVDGNSSPKEVLLDPVYDGVDEEETPQPYRFRVRMLSESEGSALPGSVGAGSVVAGSPGPLSVSEMLRSRSQDRGRPIDDAMSSSPARMESPSGRVVTVADGVTAQYVLTGTLSPQAPLTERRRVETRAANTAASLQR